MTPAGPRLPATTLEMGISHADFRRIFPRLIAPLEASHDGLVTTVTWPAGGRLEVRMSAERVRRLAGLGLPYVELQFFFDDFSAADEARFMQAFRTAFHKGGG